MTRKNGRGRSPWTKHGIQWKISRVHQLVWLNALSALVIACLVLLILVSFCGWYWYLMCKSHLNLLCNPWNVFILKPVLLCCLFHAVCSVKPFLCFICWVIVSVISWPYSPSSCTFDCASSYRNVYVYFLDAWNNNNNIGMHIVHSYCIRIRKTSFLCSEDSRWSQIILSAWCFEVFGGCSLSLWWGSLPLQQLHHDARYWGRRKRRCMGDQLIGQHWLLM